MEPKRAQGLRWRSASLFVIALCAAFWRAPSPAVPEFLPLPSTSGSALPAQFSGEFLPRVGEFAASPSLTQLPDGRLGAAWLASTQDGADNAGIWFSLLSKGNWQPPRPIADRESTAGGSFAHVRSVGYPLLYAEGSWLHLWYGSTSLGGLGGRTIQHSVSTDAGASWLKPSQLAVSPLGAGKPALGASPMPLGDGGIMLALFNPSAAQANSWLRLSATGQVLDKTHAPTLSTPANPNTPSAQLALMSGRLLLIGNPPGSRATLQFWISSDHGQSWTSGRSLESAPDGGAELTQPALLQGRDGLIHLAYTWRRQHIKHLAFSEAWLDEDNRKDKP